MLEFIFKHTRLSKLPELPRNLMQTVTWNTLQLVREASVVRDLLTGCFVAGSLPTPNLVFCSRRSKSKSFEVSGIYVHIYRARRSAKLATTGSAHTIGTLLYWDVTHWYKFNKPHETPPKVIFRPHASDLKYHSQGTSNWNLKEYRA